MIKLENFTSSLNNKVYKFVYISLDSIETIEFEKTSRTTGIATFVLKNFVKYSSTISIRKLESILSKI